MLPVAATHSENVLDALFLPLADRVVPLPADGRVLFLRARDGFRLREMAAPGWLCEQGFKPFADALERSGLTVGEASDDQRFALVLVLPPRQRDEARALYARAVRHVAPGGVVLACVANAEGAKSAEADLARLTGRVGHLSKHKCRAFWSAPLADRVDGALLAEWSSLDAPRRNAASYWSRPGLFAWDRVDPASALLVRHLPAELHGRVADLGAGFGYLACELLRRCDGITTLHLHEAERRALELARDNLSEALVAHGRKATTEVFWHDVTRGLSQRYDAIVSNPPFHQGRADQPELGRAFIAAAADALVPQGQLWLVANRHLPYEATLSTRFSEVQTVAEEGGFKVISARGAHA